MPTRDASSPGIVTTTTASNGIETGTTASFSPPADAWLYVAMGGNNAASTPTFNTPTNTGTALTWSQVGSINNGGNGSCVVWRAYNAASQAGITVTCSISNTGNIFTGNSAGMTVDVWTGCATSQTGAAVVSAASTTQNISPTVTTTASGSRVFGIAQDFNGLGTPTSSDTSNTWNNAGESSGLRAYKATDSGAPGSVAVNFNAAGAGPSWTYVLVEVLAAATAANIKLRRPFGKRSPKAPKPKAFRPGQLAASGGDVTVGLTGATATFTAGTVSPAVSVALSGTTATFSAGTLTPSTSKQLTGQTISSSAGTIGVSTDLALTGSSSTFTAGTISPELSVSMSGVSSTFSAGTLTPAIDVSLTGLSGTFTAGTMSTGNDVVVALSGSTATFSAGTLSPQSAVSLLGASSSFTAGTLSAAISTSLSGSSITATTGALTASLSVPMTGSSATFTAGTMSAQASGDVTVALTGATATFSAGQMLASGGDVIVVVTEQTGSSPGFVPNAKKKRKQTGPVMREGQVFGEEYPVSPNMETTPQAIKVRSSKISKAAVDDSIEQAIAVLLSHLL